MNYQTPNQSLTRGVSYGPNNTDLMNGIQCVSAQIDMMDGQIRNGFQEMVQIVDAATRKPRRTLISQELICCDDGSLEILSVFDDGYRMMNRFIVNVRGPIIIHRITTEHDKTIDFFSIGFQASSRAIVGKYDKLKNNYLYDLFIKAGIKFDPALTKTKIKETLYRAFAPCIENTTDMMILASKGGWQDGKFISSENFTFNFIREFSDFPVMKKSFEKMDVMESSWNTYFAEMKCIRNCKERFLVMVLPFTSILSSIFDSSVNLILNLIPIGAFPTKRCCSWFQIFNRSTLLPVSGSLAEKDFAKLFDAIKDEILILDCRTCETDTVYLKNKKLQNQKKAISIFSGDIDCPKGKITAGLVTLSNNKIFNKSVRNIFVSKESVGNLEVDEMYIEKSISAVFSEFISFVEKNYVQIKHVIQTTMHDQKMEIEMLTKTLEIIQMFGKYERFNFLERLGLRSDFDVAYALDNEIREANVIIEEFVRAVREEAVNLIFSEKREAMIVQDEILYDDEWLWFSSRQLKEILKYHGLGRYMTEILYYLKNNHLLRTDGDGSLSRRLQCGKVRLERYQIARSLFDTTGGISIVLMGKENKIDER